MKHGLDGVDLQIVDLLLCNGRASCAEITRHLAKIGCTVVQGHRAANVTAPAAIAKFRQELQAWQPWMRRRASATPRLFASPSPLT